MGELDEMYPDESKNPNVLTTKSIKKSEPTKTDIKEEIMGHLDAAIDLLNRNLRNKERAFQQLREIPKLLDKL